MIIKMFKDFYLVMQYMYTYKCTCINLFVFYHMLLYFASIMYKFFCAITEAEQREGELDASTYYKETLGITPEQALKNAEKLRQMEELVASLEAEVCSYRKNFNNN